MSQVIAVFGATGKQGSSVIDNLLRDKYLNSNFSIRALTRNVGSAQAIGLKALPGVQVVECNPEDPASLKAALTGAQYAYLMTTPGESELATGKAMADAAVAAGVQYVIFSTLPSASEISHGQYTTLNNYEAKHEIERYIRTLPIKSAFVMLGYFMENFHTVPVVAPRWTDEGYVLEGLALPSSTVPLLAAKADTGKFVNAILHEPDRYEKETLHAATREYSMEAIAKTITHAAGIHVKYKQIDEEAFKKKLPAGLENLVNTFKYVAQYGIWGPNVLATNETAKAARGGVLEEFDDYLQHHPLNLPYHKTSDMSDI